MKKISSINSLEKKVIKLKKQKKKVVLCHGVFDLLHLGHLRHLEEAKKLGDYLIVSITPNKFVEKGPGRPVFSEHLRAEALSHLNVVGSVVINTSGTASDIIKKIKPNIYCKGPDYKKNSDDITGEIKNEISSIKSVGGKIHYTHGETFSSSKIINQFGKIQTTSQKNFIKKIKKIYSFNEIKAFIDTFKKIKTLVIGETIIDQYTFCDALGKSGKEPVLVLKDLKTEEYLGGAAAISRHISTFCEKVTLLTMIGQKEEYLKFIKNKLNKNINLKYINKKDSPTIVKKRFLDSVSNNKVLGVYKLNDDQLNLKDEKLFSETLKEELPKYDLVIVSDYGHGFISRKSANLICRYSKSLSLNAQINSSNIGYHSMKNYTNINCVIINEKEIRHELRDRNSNIEDLMKKLSSEQKIKNLIVTRGSLGLILYNSKKDNFDHCEAFAKTIKDKIGAGDALLSILSLCLSKKMDLKLSTLIGSLAAAYSVENIGNKEFIQKSKLVKSIQHILK